MAQHAKTVLARELQIRPAQDKDTGVRNILKRWARDLVRDEGVAGLVIAMIIMIVSFSALAVFLSRNTGPARDLAKEEQARQSQSLVRSALLVSFVQQSPMAVLCPDTNFDGTADMSAVSGEEDRCAGGNTGTLSGTLPWRTMGLSINDARDSYGRYYTYVVAAAATERQQCEFIENDYGGDDEYTGDVAPTTSLEVLVTGQTAGQGRYVPFAIISHGANGYGGIISASATVTEDGAGVSEVANAATNPAAVYSGPYADDFDDLVIVPSATQFVNICAQSSPGEGVNQTLAEDFNDDDSDFDSTKFARGGTANPTQTSGQANFTAAGSYIATANGIFTEPAARALYVSTYWTPVANGNAFSIATRATLSDKAAASDDFAINSGDGITFRFGGAVTIRNDGADVEVGSTLNVVAGTQYFVEVYDDGNDVWGRITDVNTPTSTAEVRDTGVTDDLGSGDQKVAFISRVGTNNIDNVVVGKPMLALTGYAYAGVNDNDVTDGTISVEAWVRPRTIGAAGVIVSQWDTTSTATSSYRLYMDASGAVQLSLQDTSGGGISTTSLGIALEQNVWAHVAVTYEAATRSLHAYKDGASTASVTLTAGEMDASGVRDAAHAFAVGADTINGATAQNIFAGDISDVRIWDDVRTSSEIARCYNRRLTATGCTSANLVGNWTLDPSRTVGGFLEADTLAAFGTAGTLGTGAVWTPSLAVYFRPTSLTLCDGFKAGAYRCDFRSAANNFIVTLPGALTSIYAKVWGGGGGGYTGAIIVNDQPGGGGGFGAAQIPNTTGQIRVTIGAGGAGGPDLLTPPSGGDPSAVDYSAVPADLIVATGGAGGSLIGGAGNQGVGSFDAASVENEVAASSVANEDGAACIPAADPCLDQHYSSVGDNNTARGGAAGNNAGRAGLIILLW